MHSPPDTTPATDEDTTDSPRPTFSLVNPVHEIQDALPAEHIYIGDEAEDSAGEPTTVSRRCRFVNWVKGVQTELTFFEEGFLKIRQFRRGLLCKDHVLELRFLNLEPTASRVVRWPFLWIATAFAGITAIASLLSIVGNAPQFVFTGAVLSGTAAIVSLLLFLYRSSESFSFYTASGAAEVLTLRSNLGCFRRCRAVVPLVTAAIRDAVADNTLDEETYLRAETQAHYRLRETGVITRKACSTGISMILTKFG